MIGWTWPEPAKVGVQRKLTLASNRGSGDEGTFRVAVAGVLRVPAPATDSWRAGSRVEDQAGQGTDRSVAGPAGSPGAQERRRGRYSQQARIAPAALSSGNEYRPLPARFHWKSTSLQRFNRIDARGAARGYIAGERSNHEKDDWSQSKRRQIVRAGFVEHACHKAREGETGDEADGNA